MRLVRTFLLAASLASLPALAMAQTNTGVAVGIFTGGALAGPAGAFAGGLIGGATGAAADVATAPLYEGRTVYVPPIPPPWRRVTSRPVRFMGCRKMDRCGAAAGRMSTASGSAKPSADVTCVKSCVNGPGGFSGAFSFARRCFLGTGRRHA